MSSSSSSSSSPSFDDTEGMLYLSAVFSSIFWGIGTVQLYLYFETYGRSDKIWMKAYVFVAWALDTAQQALLLNGVYYYLVTSIGVLSNLENYETRVPATPQRIADLTLTHRTFSTTTILTAIVDFQVQLLFVWRAWMLSDSNYILVGCLLLLPVAQFTVALVFYVQSFHATTFAEIAKYRTTSQVGAGIVVVSETGLALVLVYLLKEARSGSGFKGTKSVIDRLMALFVGTGLVTGVWSCIGFIFSLTMPGNFVYVFFLECLCKIYFNCMLTSLNMRKSLREKTMNTTSQEMELSDLNSQQSQYSSRIGGSDPRRTFEVKVEKNTLLSSDRVDTFTPSSQVKNPLPPSSRHPYASPQTLEDARRRDSLSLDSQDEAQPF